MNFQEQTNKKTIVGGGEIRIYIWEWEPDWKVIVICVSIRSFLLCVVYFVSTCLPLYIVGRIKRRMKKEKDSKRIYWGIYFNFSGIRFFSIFIFFIVNGLKIVERYWKRMRQFFWCALYGCFDKISRFFSDFHFNDQIMKYIVTADQVN